MLFTLIVEFIAERAVKRAATLQAYIENQG